MGFVWLVAGTAGMRAQPNAPEPSALIRRVAAGGMENKVEC